MSQFAGQCWLITGGTSGIGLELVKLALKDGVKVLVCSQNDQQLAELSRLYPGVHTFQADLSDLAEVEQLARWVQTQHPECNALINNAAIGNAYDFFSDEQALDKIEYEIRLNLTSPLSLSKHLLSFLENQPEGRIVNISTGLVYAPKARYPVYVATKSGLHAFTQALRIQLQAARKNLLVQEALLPAVNTPWHQGPVPSIAIEADAAAQGIYQGMKNRETEIRVAGVKKFYWIARFLPALASKLVNRT